MSRLGSCGACGGLVPYRAESCPHCDARLGGQLSQLGKSVLCVAGAGVAALTLMACYGAAPCTGGTFCGGPPPTTGSTGILPDGGHGVAIQYCGLPDGGTPIPCDELDGGNDGGELDAGADGG